MGSNPRLAVVSTHPIQYYAPLFRELTERGRLDLHVFYGWRGGAGTSAHDPGFGQTVEWDIPLLDGYAHTFLQNISSDPGTHHFRGLVNPDLTSQVKGWQPDAVLIFGWSWWSHLRALWHFSGRLPVLFRGDSTLIDETSGLRTWTRRCALQWIYRHVDLALYVGQHNRAYFEVHGLNSDQLMWVPHAIENSRYVDPCDTYQREVRRWRCELGIQDEDCAILFAGKLSEKKAPDVLLEAFAQLNDPRAHLIIAGSGPQEELLRSKWEGYPHVHFIGFQNQSTMPVVYRLGEVFVLPSRGPGETWGLAINEAMACGRAVVASSRVGCAPDLINNGRNGYVFSADDVLALSNILNRLVADGDLRREMGRASQQCIRDWSIERAAERHEKAVLTLLENRD